MRSYPPPSSVEGQTNGNISAESDFHFLKGVRKSLLTLMEVIISIENPRRSINIEISYHLN